MSEEKTDALVKRLRDYADTMEADAWAWPPYADIREAADALSALSRRCDALERGLRPFASVAENDVGADEVDEDRYVPMYQRNRAPNILVGDLRHASRLLSEASPSPASEWQPIESAPKDGTRIVVWNGAAHFARWSDDCHMGQFEKAPGWQVFECEDDTFYAWGLSASEVTHWMPLPQPPLPAAKDSRDGGK